MFHLCFASFAPPAHARMPTKQKWRRIFFVLPKTKQNISHLCFASSSNKLIWLVNLVVTAIAQMKPPREISVYSCTKKKWIIFQSQLLFQFFFPLMFCFVNEAKHKWSKSHRNLPISLRGRAVSGIVHVSTYLHVVFVQKKKKNALILKMYVLQLQYTNLSGKKSQTLHYHKIMRLELLAVKKSWTREFCIQENFASHFLQNAVSLFCFCHLFFAQKQQENWKNVESSSTFFQFRSVF